MTTDSRQLLLLLTWMSPAFPTGAFAYSHGLEWAIDSRLLRVGEDLKGWIGDLLRQGSGWNDAVIFARCWEDEPSLAERTGPGARHFA
jgi:urease accessory protein